MAILNIVKTGDPILAKKSRTVEAVTPRILRLLDDMADTLRDSGGVGLAAVQVGVLRRVVIVDHEELGYIELINPEIIEESKKRQQELEGCLSIPGQWGITDRPETVTVRAMNRKGETFTVSGSGLTARAFCHELDHLEGVLFTDVAIEMLSPEEVERMSKD